MTLKRDQGKTTPTVSLGIAEWVALLAVVLTVGGSALKLAWDLSSFVATNEAIVAALTKNYDTLDRKVSLLSERNDLLREELSILEMQVRQIHGSAIKFPEEKLQ